MPIKYKVVTKPGRRSVIYMTAEGSEWGKLFRRYYKGDYVSADPHTVGLLVFNRARDAREFAESYPRRGRTEVVKVMCHGRGKTIKKLYKSTIIWNLHDLSYIDYFGHNKTARTREMWAPSGTMAYKSLTVLT